ncbi:MAG TPA: sugar phosphate isomerase/epimerase [Flavisolibacter sp.]
MFYQRRDFLKTAGILGSGFLLGQYLPACNAIATNADISKNFGIQLYTLRDVLPSDPKGVLTQLASFGYKEIESYEGDKGMFWGMKNTEFKKLMDDLGMKLVASHCDMDKDFERKVEEAAAIGMKYLVCPWIGPQEKLDVFKKTAEKFNQKGEVCKKHGLRFAYHNHDYSFKKLEGQYPQDVLMKETDKDLVDYEMDIYWVVTAGQDPVEWFNRYPGRFTLSHIKDRKKNAPLSDGDASTDLGKGSIDFTTILASARQQGMVHFLVEQERYDDTTPMMAAKAGAEYLRNIKFKN